MTEQLQSLRQTVDWLRKNNKKLMDGNVGLQKIVFSLQSQLDNINKAACFECEIKQKQKLKAMKTIKRLRKKLKKTEQDLEIAEEEAIYTDNDIPESDHGEAEPSDAEDIDLFVEQDQNENEIEAGSSGSEYRPSQDYCRKSLSEPPIIACMDLDDDDVVNTIANVPCEAKSESLVETSDNQASNVIKVIPSIEDNETEIEFGNGTDIKISTPKDIDIKAESDVIKTEYDMVVKEEANVIVKNESDIIVKKEH